MPREQNEKRKKFIIKTSLTSYTWTKNSQWPIKITTLPYLTLHLNSRSFLREFFFLCMKIKLYDGLNWWGLPFGVDTSNDQLQLTLLENFGSLNAVSNRAKWLFLWVWLFSVHFYDFSYVYCINVINFLVRTLYLKILLRIFFSVPYAC